MRSRRPYPRLSVTALEDRSVPAAVPVGFTVTSDWASGFGANVVVTNTGPAVADWQLSFDFDRSIDSIWNARVVSKTGTKYVVEDAGYNGAVAAGGTVSFGFNGSRGGVTQGPTNWDFVGVGASPPASPPTSPPASPPATTPALTVSDVSAAEGAGAVAAFTVSLSKAATSPVTVRYATVAGTAAAGADFNPVSGTLTFAPGETRKDVRVTLVDDAVVESTEQFKLTLSAPAGATIAGGEGVATVADNDTVPLPPPPAAAAKFNYTEALQKALFFYEANRSGDLPDNYAVNWRGDSAMTDGKDVGLDLTGGYYDAGDHVKFGLPMASSMTVLAWGLIQWKDGYEKSGQLDRARDAVRWGTDFIMKAHPSPDVYYAQVGNGELDHAEWIAPELMTMARPAYKLDPTKPGSDAAGGAAAALAAAYVAFKDVDPAYAAKLLGHAKDLFRFADTYRGKYSDSIPDAAKFYNSHSGYNDELVWAAAWLYKATGDAGYLAKAEAIYAQNFAGQTMTWTQSWDDNRYGASILLAGLTGKDQYKQDAERYLDYWSVGINGGATKIKYTPGGLAFLNGWGSLRYATTTSMMALMYADTVKDYGTRYRDFALSQVNYALGANPRNSSYMVGFGQNSPVNPHHRGASGVWDGNHANPTPNRHVLYGALVGGPESADDFNYHDDRTNYISNEVALDYNAGITGALAWLAGTYGGEKLANFPAPEAKGNEFFVEASVNQSGPTFTEVRAVLNNRSAWPARASTQLGFRYYLDLSEVYAAGYSTADVEVKSNYSQGATVGPLTAWDAAKRIYYVDVSFAGQRIAPGAGTFAREAQLRVGLKNGLPAAAWDPTNDWSYQGIAVGRDALKMSSYIPVYEAGAKLFGETPSGTPLPGTPGLSVANVSVTEGTGGTKAVTFTVRLSAASAAAVTVNYATAGGTATSGVDFTAAAGTLTFAPGETEKTVTVTVASDAVAEANETFKLVLSSPTGAVLSQPEATATIVDDDAPTSPPPASPPPASPPTTPGTSALTGAFKVKDQWSSGLVGEVTISNPGTTPVVGWTVEIDIGREITGIWGAEIVGKVGTKYTLRAVSYNATVPAGGRVTFGFQAGAGGPVGTPAVTVRAG
jgi:endoglucanase